MLGGGGGWRWRASTVRITSPLAMPGLQRLGTGGLDRGQPMIEHRAQHLDELAIAVGVALQLGADLGQAGGRSQSLNGAPLRKAPGFFIRTGR